MTPTDEVRHCAASETGCVQWYGQGIVAWMYRQNVLTEDFSGHTLELSPKALRKVLMKEHQHLITQR